MSTIDEISVPLSDAECRDLLENTSVGRLAVDIAGQPEIFPINYLMTPDGIVFCSGAGTKLAGAALMHRVAFEIDGYDASTHSAWSVIVKGWAREIERSQELYDAEDLPLFPWVESPKPHFVSIEILEMTGRRFPVSNNVVVEGSISWPRFPRSGPR